jgi:hypothetical protein
MPTITKIYLLQLEQGKYYVASSDLPKEEIISYHSNKDNEWLKLYKPIKIMSEMKGDVYDEEMYTIKTMKIFGLDNVRGSSFSETILLDHDKMKVQEIINNNFRIKDNKTNSNERAYNPELIEKIINDKNFDNKVSAHVKQLCDGKNNAANIIMSTVNYNDEEEIYFKFARDSLYKTNSIEDLEQLSKKFGASSDKFKNMERKCNEILEHIRSFSKIENVILSNFILEDDKNRFAQCFERVNNLKKEFMVIDFIIMVPLYKKDKGCFFKVYADGKVEFFKHFNPSEYTKIGSKK